MDAITRETINEILAHLADAKIAAMNAAEDIAELADIADQIEDMESELRAIT
jgi:hypothetical protein